MRTAAICPTCATYTNAVCVIYDGPYLATLDIDPLTNLDTIIQTINSVISTISTPTLQQVTEQGLITDQPVEFEDGFRVYDPVNLQWVDIKGTSDGFRAKVASSTADFLIANEGNIAIGDGTGKFGNIGIANLPALASKTYELPNISTSSKILVTSVNGVDAGTDGNVTVSTSLPYTVYSALISFSGSTASAIVLENTLGVTLNWSNPSNGVLRGTAASGSPFTSNKTWISSGSLNNAGTVYFVASRPTNISPTQAVDFTFFLHDGTLTGTPTVDNFSIEIRVYP